MFVIIAEAVACTVVILSKYWNRYKSIGLGQAIIAEKQILMYRYFKVK